MMKELHTTTDVLEASMKLNEQAKEDMTLVERDSWETEYNTVKRACVNALESGAFTGDARQELRHALSVLEHGHAYASRHDDDIYLQFI